MIYREALPLRMLREGPDYDIVALCKKNATRRTVFLIIYERRTNLFTEVPLPVHNSLEVESAAIISCVVSRE